MDYLALDKCSIFKGFTATDLRAVLADTPHHILCYDKEEIIFHQMDEANKVGIVLEGRVQAQKTFPNGSMVNVTTRMRGDMIGPAAVFSRNHKYPCDVMALEPTCLMILHKADLLALMQKDRRILDNFIAEISTATYMLQQRLELFSYTGIAQKTAFWLLLRQQQSGKSTIAIPESISKWALLMNVSRPSLHRELKKLEGKGYIRCAAKQIEILDGDGLQEVLSE